MEQRDITSRLEALFQEHDNSNQQILAQLTADLREQQLEQQAKATEQQAKITEQKDTSSRLETLLHKQQKKNERMEQTIADLKKNIERKELEQQAQLQGQQDTLVGLQAEIQEKRVEGEAKQLVEKVETDLKEQQRDQQRNLTEQQKTISRLEVLLQQQQDSATKLQAKLDGMESHNPGELQELWVKETTSHNSRDSYLLWGLISILVVLLAMLVFALFSGRPCCGFPTRNIIF